MPLPSEPNWPPTIIATLILSSWLLSLIAVLFEEILNLLFQQFVFSAHSFQFLTLGRYIIQKFFEILQSWRRDNNGIASSAHIFGDAQKSSAWIFLQGEDKGFALDFEPSAKGRFLQDEAGARDARLGLWKGCFVAPQEFRLGQKDGSLHGAACRTDRDRQIREALFPEDIAMPPTCSIKGKFAVRARVTGDVGIYHLRACPSYPAITKPDRWFCSEDDAEAAGFRRAYNCRAKNGSK